MIFAITQFIKFDVEKEKIRLSELTPDQSVRQQQILQLFLDGKYQECYQAMAHLPYDEEKECDEAEYVHPFIFDNVRAVMEHPNVRIARLNADEHDEPIESDKAQD